MVRLIFNQLHVPVRCQIIMYRKLTVASEKCVAWPSNVQSVQDWDFPRRAEEEEIHLPWPVAVVGPTSQEMLHRQHLLVISGSRLVVGPYRLNTLEMFPAWVTWPSHEYW